MAKKYFSLCVLILTVGFWACTSTPKETSLNTDANGEPDTLVNFQNALDEATVIKATCNGAEKEFKYVDVTANPDPKYKTYYNRKKDGSVAYISIIRTSNADMREKISMSFSNHDVETMQLPYTISGQQDAQKAKFIRFVYEVKKSGVYIPYYSDDMNSKVAFTSYKDGVLEGTFSCKVTNQAKRTIDIQNGSFKVKLDKIELQ
jgi:hypothetical protein